jgi:hypothetical protein
MAASGSTPTGPGTTGKQWWPTNWHYFVMPEAVKEALRSDGTAFTVVGDSNITSGALLVNGSPKYPIVISLASEAIRDDEIAQFTNYVAAGGFLLVGSSSFTRTTNGTSRGDFAIANQMGVHMVTANLSNWGLNTTFTKSVNHRLVNDVPAGILNWRLPSSSEEQSWNSTASPPTTPNLLAHSVWQINASTALEVASGDNYSYLLVQQYGKGWFIYYAPMQPLITHGGWSPGMYAYILFRRAIEWAFESARLPVPKLSPWPYQYDAAFMVRHDLEDFANEIADIEASAQFEQTNGAKGDYYFCTGTLREDMSGNYNTNTVVTSLRRAIVNNGATIGPHNGGLKNANFTLNHSDYNYWHWGPDEVLNITPSGYSSGKAYAMTSVSNSFIDIERWLSGLMTNGMRVWCAPYFNATRENSYDIQSQLGVKINGEQKLSPFPHWTFSTQTPGKRYGFLQQPTSEWFTSSDVAQSMEWHSTNTTVHAEVDFYYNLGALVNVYAHTLSTGEGQAGDLEPDYVTYCANTNLHPRIWGANGVGIYQWWLQRSNIQVSVSYTTNSSQASASFTITGATDPNDAIELLMPAQYCGLQIQTNGATVPSAGYRINGQVLKIRVGTSVANATVSYTLCSLGPNLPFYSENFDGASAPALPAGWTTSASGAQSAWITTNSSPDSGPNAAFSRDPAASGISELDSPAINLPAGQATLSFRNNYNLESGYDGGVLEIKIGSGAYTDIVAAGGNFVTGGYVTTLPTGNPLVGQQAWSGNSGGYITTTVTLPSAASGQTVQFRWRCGADNTTSAPGWRIDSLTISNRAWLCCGNVNPPVLPAQTNRTIAELSPTLIVNTATDTDSPGSVTYQLVSPPAGAAIDFNGIISWTPGESQGPGVYTLTTIASDNGSPPLFATNSFAVTVTEVNSAPSLPVQTNRTIPKLLTLVVTNTGSDSDIPANNLFYSLQVAPTNAAISASGVITWTPTAAQDHTTNLFQTVVTDDGSPSLQATNSFQVIVNSDPLITLNSTSLVAEGCTPTNNAIDSGETVTVLFAFKNIGLGDTANLVVTLLPTNGVVSPSDPQSYGVVTAGGGAVSQPFTFTANAICGGVITPTLQLQDGGLNLGTATVSFQLGQIGPVLVQNFDSVTTPALPSGWTTSASGAQSAWTTVSTTPDSAPNAAFSTDAAAVGQNELDSPAIVLPIGPSQLTFRNNYNFETGTGTDGYDGGVIEIKIGANPYQDIISAGGSFISGGYNSVIDSAYSNPLAGRSAWSGNSGGYITTAISMPPSAAGQTIQLRWVSGTDNGNGSAGWRIDSISITGRLCCASSTALLPAQSGRSIPELTTLVVTNTALTNAAWTYSLINPPTGAQIDANGVITWTPSEAQGPSTNTLTTYITNNAAPPLTGSNSFTVIVTEVNSAPVLSGQINRTIAELTTLTVTNTATDSDIPANVISYALTVTNSGGPVTNATISAAGVISWTATEAQGPSTNTFVTVATDNGSPPLKATNSFTVVVTEVNSRPVLPVQTNRTVAELTLLTVTNTATDSDIPANTLAYALTVSNASGPVTNANISAAGVISWTPTEAQGPSTNTFTTVVTDNGSPNLSATNSFTVVVTEVNTAPTFVQTPTARTINELSTLTVTNNATDSDIPANTLSYTLSVASTSGPVTNAAISPNGVITWIPSEAQGPSTNTFTTIVTDNGSPSLSATNSFTVVVNEVNSAPAFVQTPASRTINELTTLTVTNSATDSDIPANTLSYTLSVASTSGPVTNAAISANGVITWTPSEAQGPSTNTFTTVVTDNGSPNLSATNSFTVVVNELNTAPAFIQTPGDVTIDELTTLTITNAASDSDIPANTLTYTLNVAGAGAVVTNASISAQGVITWTPTEAQGPSTNTFTTIVTDNGSPNLSATNFFTVVVREVNSPPILPFIADRTIADQSILIVTNTATDPDLPANNLTYNLLSRPPGALPTDLGNPPPGSKIDTNGVITWTPSLDQGPSTNIFTVIVTDDGLPPLSATNSFSVTVLAPPLPPTIRSLTISSNQVTLTWTAVAGHTYRIQYTTDMVNWTNIVPDAPANGPTCSCSHSCGGSNYRFYRVLLVQ